MLICALTSQTDIERDLSLRIAIGYHVDPS